jgi:predicted DNA-binding transcriptional regulator AlpA
MSSIESQPSPGRLLSSEEAAAVLGVKPKTLRVWRWRGSGPPFVRLGDSEHSRAAYRQADIDAWAAARTFRSTTAEAASRGQGR